GRTPRTTAAPACRAGSRGRRRSPPAPAGADRRERPSRRSGPRNGVAAGPLGPRRRRSRLREGSSGQRSWLRICVICRLARSAADLTDERPVKMDTSMFCRTLALSTFAQFLAAGTNQLYLAARANGARVGLDALIATSEVVFGMLPAFAIEVIDA